MCYKTKSHIEKAVSTLLELLNTEREYLPALVCLSQAYLMLKQAPKARNHLKRVAKMNFMAEMADDFERGWLMLSDVYIVSGKYDLAEELCRRCLASNKSCAKAWEAPRPRTSLTKFRSMQSTMRVFITNLWGSHASGVLIVHEVYPAHPMPFRAAFADAVLGGCQREGDVIQGCSIAL